MFMLRFQNRLPATLKPHILCIEGNLPPSNPPFYPYPSLTVQFVELIHWNDRFSTIVTTHEYTKYDVLLPRLQLLGRNTLPTHLPVLGHQPTTDLLTNLNIPQTKTKCHEIILL